MLLPYKDTHTGTYVGINMGSVLLTQYGTCNGDKHAQERSDGGGSHEAEPS